MSQYHLAQANIAHMLAPIDDPVMAGFVARLDEINALADRSPGFIWRLQTEDGNATSLRVFDNDMLIINTSVWESIDALHQFTYYSDHVEVFRQRRDWFEKMDTPYQVLWWIPAGQVPTPDDIKARLDYLTQHGPTPLAFTFKQRFTVEELLAYQEQV